MTPYTTLAKKGEYEFTEKKSVFIGKAIPVSSEVEALDFIAEIRKKYPDARHTAYAYSVFEENISTAKFSDDGEPQGTAGKPILDIFSKQGITNTCVTVTRYFGGILLGAPGLLRAYTTAASGAVSEAGTIVIPVCRTVSFSLSYGDYGAVERLTHSPGIFPSPAIFTDTVFCSYAVDDSICEKFVRSVTDAVSGRADITVSDPFHYSP